jgi:putative ABC transport system ATP-binding protein
VKTVLETKNLVKSYGKKDSLFTALDDINLEIKTGESIAIIGKSGSGKSTLMHLLALLDSPTSGEVLIGNVKSSDLSRRQKDKIRNKRFGFVFQQFFLNGNNTVLDNVILPLKIAGVSRRERVRRGLQALADVELSDKAKNRANDLSGGQKQRAVIARALINNPSVIFADEPTGNLDSVTGKRVEDMLFGLNKSKNITLIIVTHDEDLAVRCDRQIHIKDGHLQKEGK